MIALAIILASLATVLGVSLAFSTRSSSKNADKALASKDEETKAKDLARKELELREDAEDDRDHALAAARKADEEKIAALHELGKVTAALHATRNEFAAYIAKKQATASPEQAIEIMDDILARRLTV